MAGTRKSTLALVAERAGVSIASVSRVLNGLAASADITERVQQAASDLGYVPDATARSLKVGRTEQIALAVADAANPVYMSMMNEVSRVIADGGYRLVLSSTGADPADQLDVLNGLNRGFVDGLILSPLRVTDELVEHLRRSRIPIVVLGSLPEGVPLDNVRADSATGMRLALKHLAKQGRRRIAFLNGPVDTVPGAARLRGYLAAVEQYGTAQQADLQVEADDFTFAAGLPAAEALLDQSSPDAIVCANDLLAVAALKAIARRGLRVPQDIAVVGMDDTDIAELIHPALTSVDLGAAKRARTAAKLLLRRLADPDAPVRQVVIEPKLRVRESSAKEAALKPLPAKEDR